MRVVALRVIRLATLAFSHRYVDDSRSIPKCGTVLKEAKQPKVLSLLLGGSIWRVTFRRPGTFRCLVKCNLSPVILRKLYLT